MPTLMKETQLRWTSPNMIHMVAQNTLELQVITERALYCTDQTIKEYGDSPQTPAWGIPRVAWYKTLPQLNWNIPACLLF